MIAYAAMAFLFGFVLFLLAFSLFMYHENRKFGDNQFTVKLLPPPPRLAAGLGAAQAQALIASAPLPGRDQAAAPAPIRDHASAPALSRPG